MERLEDTKLYFDGKLVGYLDGLSGSEQDLDGLRIHIGSFIVSAASREIKQGSSVNDFTVTGINLQGTACKYKFIDVVIADAKLEEDKKYYCSFIAKEFVPVTTI